jgi:hypothetical protein
MTGINNRVTSRNEDRNFNGTQDVDVIDHGVAGHRSKARRINEHGAHEVTAALRPNTEWQELHDWLSLTGR